MTTAQNPAESSAVRSLVTSASPVQSRPPTTARGWRSSLVGTASDYGGGCPPRFGNALVGFALVPSTARRRARRTWPQRALILFNLALVVACLGSAGAFALVRQKAAEIPRVAIPGAARGTEADSDEPRNILLVGTDSAAGLDKDDPARRGDRDVTGQLADVIMILRVDPKETRASLLSIPRDSWVPIAPKWNKTKINSSIAGSRGPEGLISTIKHNFGISVDNYAQVDFGGFRQLIEVLDGVPVYLKQPVRDRRTALWLVETGCITVDPIQALAYARSRHFQYQDGPGYDPKGTWHDDPTGDLGRISRQQQFLQAAAQRAVDEGIRNPTTALGLVNAALAALKVDERLDVGQIIDLIRRFRSFSVDSLERYQLPTTEGGNPSISYQNVDWEAAEPMLDVFRGGSPTGVPEPRDVIVDVAAPVAAGTPIVSALRSAGFDASSVDTTAVTSNKKSSSGSNEDEEEGDGASESAGLPERTVVRFGPKGVDAVRLLQSHLPVDIRLDYQADIPGRVLELSLGADVTELRTPARPIEEIPVPSTTTPGSRKRSSTSVEPTTSSSSTTVVDPGAETASTVPAPEGSSLPETVTTTTAIGVVPLDPVAVERC